jgi:cyclin A
MLKESYQLSNPQHSAYNRLSMLDWLVGAARHFKLKDRTLYLALDFLSQMNLPMFLDETQVKYRALTALFTSSKYEEIYPPKLDEFCNFEKPGFAKDRVLLYEAELLQNIEFDTTRVLAFDFFTIFAGVASLSKAALDFGSFLLCLPFGIPELTSAKPSAVAFSVCYLLHKLF